MHLLQPLRLMIFRHVKSIISVKYDGGNDQTDKKFFTLVSYYDQLQSQTVTHFLALPVPKIAGKTFWELVKDRVSHIPQHNMIDFLLLHHQILTYPEWRLLCQFVSYALKGFRKLLLPFRPMLVEFEKYNRMFWRHSSQFFWVSSSILALLGSAITL